VPPPASAQGPSADSSVAPPPVDPPATGETRIEMEDDGKSFDVARGSPLTFELTRNAGTGYAWRVGEVDPTILARQADAGDGAPEDAAANVPGGPRRDSYRFVAVGPGTSVVTLTLARSFGSTAPARTVRVTIHVR
jgi:predicted secreted protein